jgi:uracil-DNA glycosylase
MQGACTITGMEIAALLPDDWRAAMAEELQQPYIAELEAFLDEEYARYTVYPPQGSIMAALTAAPLADVSVVILGQDPYHGEGQAMGLSFSVPQGVRIPPSLKRVFRELESDIAVEPAVHGDLTAWSEQGVLLLNSVLTVRAKTAGSHAKRGWEQFTDALLAAVNRERDGVVFMLWGNYAKIKGGLIDRDRHLVLEAAHPSPLARDGWFGNQHFSQANTYLQEHGKAVINWKLPTV